jgi:hypothetical protein
MVFVGSGGGVEVARAVGVGTGEGGVSEARSGSRDAHPAVNMYPTKITNRRMRDFITG